MANNGTKKQAKALGKEPEIIIDRVIPDEMRSTFANHMVVQNAGFGEFHISFFEIRHPIVLGADDTEKLKKSGSVRADCVARIVVTAERLQGFIAALAQVHANSVLAKETPKDSHKGDEKGSEKGKKHAG